MLGQEGFVDIQVLHRQGVSINPHSPYRTPRLLA